MKIQYSIVIPAYNEEKNLNNGSLDSVFNYLKKQKYEWELILVDDGSMDNTLSLLQSIAEKEKNTYVLPEPHRGKAGAVIAGMLKGTGKVILFTDLDQATPIIELENFIPKLNEGYDIVIGSRHGRKGAPFVRRIIASGFHLLCMIIFRLPYKDTQCGFKAFTKEASQKIFSRLKVFKDQQVIEGAAVTAGFDLEILYIARKLKLKVAEVNVEWSYQKTIRVNPIKDSWQGLRDILKVRMNAIFGKYNI